MNENKLLWIETVLSLVWGTLFGIIVSGVSLFVIGECWERLGMISLLVACFFFLLSNKRFVSYKRNVSIQARLLEQLLQHIKEELWEILEVANSDSPDAKELKLKIEDVHSRLRSIERRYGKIETSDTLSKLGLLLSSLNESSEKIEGDFYEERYNDILHDITRDFDLDCKRLLANGPSIDGYRLFLLHFRFLAIVGTTFFLGGILAIGIVGSKSKNQEEKERTEYQNKIESKIDSISMHMDYLRSVIDGFDSQGRANPIQLNNRSSEILDNQKLR